MDRNIEQFVLEIDTVDTGKHRCLVTRVHDEMSEDSLGLVTLWLLTWIGNASGKRLNLEKKFVSDCV